MVCSIQEAQTQLSKLLDLVRHGEEVVITSNGHTVAKLVAVSDTPTKIPFDSMKGEISWTEGWETALTEEETDAFWEGRW